MRLVTELIIVRVGENDVTRDKAYAILLNVSFTGFHIPTIGVSSAITSQYESYALIALTFDQLSRVRPSYSIHKLRSVKTNCCSTLPVCCVRVSFMSQSNLGCSLSCSVCHRHGPLSFSLFPPILRLSVADGRKPEEKRKLP